MTTPRRKYRSKRERRKTLARVTALQAVRKAAGLCQDCGGKLVNRGGASLTRCADCRAKRAARAQQRRRAKWQQAGQLTTRRANLLRADTVVAALLAPARGKKAKAKGPPRKSRGTRGASRGARRLPGAPVSTPAPDLAALRVAFKTEHPDAAAVAAKVATAVPVRVVPTPATPAPAPAAVEAPPVSDLLQELVDALEQRPAARATSAAFKSATRGTAKRTAKRTTEPAPAKRRGRRA